MTTPTRLDTPRTELPEAPLPARDLGARRAPGERVPRRIGQLTLLVAPGLWVATVVVLSLALGLGEQLNPLLAAAPAIACVGTGRRQCVVLGCACALIALAPFQDDFGRLGERVGTALAIMVITGASYLVAQRRVRLQLAYDQVLRIAEVTQRVLLRPVPARIGPVTAAVEYLSAATGAHVGGDFYEVIETPYGIRAILGDVRGNGLDALSGAAALLGAFREAGAVEPALETVAARLDAALARHAAGTRRAELTASHRPMIEARRAAEPDACTKNDARTKNTVREIRESEVWAEDFATAVLVQIPYPNPAPSNPAPSGSVPAVAAPAVPGRAPGEWHGVGANEVKLVVCGHPSPYLVHGDTARAVEPERATLPLGLGSLVAGPYAASSRTVAFEPGDSLVLYTDGVSDARDRSGAFFPLGELLDAVGGRAEPESVARLVRARLLKHMNGELNDDAALLVLSRI